MVKALKIPFARICFVGIAVPSSELPQIAAVGGVAAMVVLVAEVVVVANSELVCFDDVGEVVAMVALVAGVAQLLVWPLGIPFVGTDFGRMSVAAVVASSAAMNLVGVAAEVQTNIGN